MGALSACGGGGDDSGGSDDVTGFAQSDSAARSAPEAQPGRVPVTPAPSHPSRRGRASARSSCAAASLNLKVDTLTAAAQRIRAIANQQGGVVVNEELYSGEQGRDTSGSITISVPASSLDATISLIEKVGDVQFRNTSSEDVTATYVDTQARVESMTASVARMRELISKASTVADLVTHWRTSSPSDRPTSTRSPLSSTPSRTRSRSRRSRSRCPPTTSSR